MSPFWGGPRTALGVGTLCLVGAAGATLVLVPVSLGLILGLWVVASVPLGRAVGHCALDRDQ